MMVFLFIINVKLVNIFILFSPFTQAKCRHFIFLNAPFILENPNEFYCETNLYLNVEQARLDRGLCGENATYYKRRLN